MSSTEENIQTSLSDASLEAVEDKQAGDLSYEELLNLYDESLQNLAEGEVVTGKVIDVTSNHVIVDVGYKSEGLISRDEFTDHEGNLTVEVGDEVDVLLESTEDAEGHVQLSKHKADRMKVWGEIESAYNNDEVILIGAAETGETIRVEDLAEWAETIPYEVLTNINTRVPRVYVRE